MNIGQAFASKWLKSSDIGDDDLVLTISDVVIETVGQGEQEEQKPVVYFTETDKGLVLNKTNADSIAKLHGPETDEWAGKRIALFATEVDFGGKQVLALRVRLKAPKTNGNGNPPPANHVPTKEEWLAWCKANHITDAAILSALGTRKVSEWVVAEPGRTLAQAQELILKSVKAAEEPF